MRNDVQCGIGFRKTAAQGKACALRGAPRVRMVAGDAPLPGPSDSMKSYESLPPLAKGCLLMVLGIFFLSTMDAVAKSLSERYEIMQIVWARYAGQTLLVFALLRAKSGSFFRTRHLPLQIARSSMLFAATVCFFSGISLAGLAEATALLQLSPLLLTLGAFLFLRESFGPLRFAGVCAGLAGALVIIRPGTEVFSIYSVLPLAAAALFSGYALMTRFLSRDEHTWTNFLYTTCFGTAIATFVVPFYWETPGLADAGIMLGMSILGGMGQYAMIRAFFFAEASALASFGYTALVFAGFYGMVFFGESPDAWSIAGAAIVVGAGLFVWKREAAGSARPAGARHG